ncbi:MAG: high-affinity nickel-transport family protein [Polyangiaceae bacterium]
MVTTLLPLLALGFFLGIRHATDPDHVVAVTTILAREKRVSVAARIGVLWGVGHTFTILLVGGAIIVFGIVIPPRLGLTMEFSVAVMLVLLGGLNLAGVFGAPSSHSRVSVAARPIAIGVVHGLAGSAAIALLVLAAVHTALAAIAYLAIFSLGTVMGMMLMTSALAYPLVATQSRFTHIEPWIARGTGVVSVLFGLFMAYQVGIHDGLFSGHPVWSPH